ncbi:MAG: hypothetical protein O7H39_14485 [Gammaproteobacteria bacterium]|nr:hypothetical protein [Gammaproteobacteria bacterium]
MILKPGNWLGRGSYRSIGETLGINFEADFSVQEDDQGIMVEGTVDVAGGATIELTIWIVPDEFGTYAVSVRGSGIDVEGTAKLESIPHLGLLWSEDGETHVAFTLFALRESFGFRGFAKTTQVTITWELALKPQQNVVTGGNVVSIDARRRPK